MLKIAVSGVSMPDLIVLVAKIYQIVLENSSESLKFAGIFLSLGGSGLTGFEGGDPKPTRQRQVLEIRTRVRLSVQSD